MGKIKISELQTELTRLHTLVMLADRKIAFVFVLYSIIFGFYFRNIETILVSFNYKCNFLLIFFLVLLLLLGFTNIYLTIFPRLENRNIKPLLYYGYISSLSLKKFQTIIGTIDEKALKKEVIEQVHTLSIINTKKMDSVNKSIIFLILLVGISLIYLGINFEQFLGKQ